MGITVNFNKAKEIIKIRLRKEREPLLQALDVQFQRALETGADTSAIVTEKQRLRDITKLADEAQNLDDLKAIQVT
jgi:SpoVK/Ycf46/Vps4 family AAA+-type ATPase